MIRGYESLKSNFQPLLQEVHAKKIQTHIEHIEHHRTHDTIELITQNNT